MFLLSLALSLRLSLSLSSPLSLSLSHTHISLSPGHWLPDLLEETLKKRKDKWALVRMCQSGREDDFKAKEEFFHRLRSRQLHVFDLTHTHIHSLTHTYSLTHAQTHTPYIALVLFHSLFFLPSSLPLLLCLLLIFRTTSLNSVTSSVTSPPLTEYPSYSKSTSHGLPSPPPPPPPLLSPPLSPLSLPHPLSSERVTHSE